jgi:hypothetical protein
MKVFVFFWDRIADLGRKTPKKWRHGAKVIAPYRY